MSSLMVFTLPLMIHKYINPLAVFDILSIVLR